MCMPSISNVIYRKFLHGTASNMLSGKNANVMLELSLTILSVNKDNCVFMSEISSVFLTEYLLTPYSVWKYQTFSAFTTC